MSKNSPIQWTHHTFNPWWGCTKVSPECDSCYAETGAVRYGWSETGSHFPIWGKDARRRFFGDKHWQEPLKWNREAQAKGENARVFCASYGDVLEDREDLIPHRLRLQGLILDTMNLDWLLLSKRPQNFCRMFATWNRFPPNVWAMTTVGCKSSMWRIDALREVDTVVRGLSVEPLLEDLGALSLRGIHWVIVGGESGHGARPMNIEWVRSIIRQCRDAGVACFVKQMGAKPYETNIGVAIKNDAVVSIAANAHPHLQGFTRITDSDGTYLRKNWRLKDKKGGNILEWPEDLRVREVPR